MHFLWSGYCKSPHVLWPVWAATVCRQLPNGVLRGCTRTNTVHNLRISGLSGNLWTQVKVCLSVVPSQAATTQQWGILLGFWNSVTRLSRLASLLSAYGTHPARNLTLPRLRHTEARSKRGQFWEDQNVDKNKSKKYSILLFKLHLSFRNQRNLFSKYLNNIIPAYYQLLGTCYGDFNIRPWT